MKELSEEKIGGAECSEGLMNISGENCNITNNINQYVLKSAIANGGNNFYRDVEGSEGAANHWNLVSINNDEENSQKPLGYYEGMMCIFIPSHDAHPTSPKHDYTVNVNGLGNVILLDKNGFELQQFDVILGEPTILLYTEGKFRVMTSLPMPCGTITIAALNGAGEISPPKGWYFANGDPLIIEYESRLFERIGKTYGGSETQYNLPRINNLLSSNDMGYFTYCIKI